jgi:uncharacterized protein (DUF58 family)
MSLPRPGRRAFGLLIGALLLFAAGTNDQAGWLFVLAALLLGAAVAGAILPAARINGVAVERIAPGEAFQGSEARVKLIVLNRTRGAKGSLVVRDDHLATTTSWLPRLGPGERVTIETTRRAARRGVMTGDEVRLSTGAPFGVAIATRKEQASCRTIVYPRVVRLRLASPTAKRADRQAVAAGLRRGLGQEFLSIRDYRVGDSMRHIHWPSTARMGAFMVREFERQQSPTVGIFLDASAEGGTENTPLDLACSAAASIALAALESGHDVELAAARGAGVERHLGRDRGEVLRWLAELQADFALPAGAALREAVPFLARCDSAVLALPTWRTAADVAEPASALMAVGVPVAVILIDVTTFDPDRSRPPTLSSNEIEDLERALARSGIRLCRVGADGDLAGSLEAALAGLR